MTRRLGVIAGAGALPWRVVAGAEAQGRDVFILGVQGAVEADRDGRTPDAVFRLGAAGDGFAALKAAGVRDVVMAGAVLRPRLRDLRPDLRTAAFFARIGRRALGDDGLLKAVIAEVERDGFVVRGAHEFLAADDQAPAGLWTKAAPDEAARIDAARAFAAAQALGAADIGQAAIAQQGVVLGVEGVEGTDALIARCAALARPGPGGVLAKAKKPQQDDRADLPTIGAQTIRLAAQHGLRGVVVEVGGALVVDFAATVAAADAAGVFLAGWSLDDAD